jgi:hypothetical protein
MWRGGPYDDSHWCRNESTEDTMTGIARKLRQRRNEREFDRALRNAPPSMRQELRAVAARSDFRG